MQIVPETGICHIRVPHAGNILEFLSSLDLSPLGISPSEELARDWLTTGGVYVNSRRCLLADTIVSPDQIVRLHTRRKRYPAASLGRWNERVVARNDDFLVFNKPSGLPTHATLDNYVENAKYVLEKELGCSIYTTHRLDIPTRGLLLCALRPEAQSRINRVLARGEVTKTYQARSRTAVPPGAYTHYIDPQSRVPRTILAEPQPGWWECRLVVEEVTPIDQSFFVHRVRLLTGKTHQIRAQFAALGAPLVGDVTYGGETSSPNDEFGLECAALAFRLGATQYAFTL